MSRSLPAAVLVLLLSALVPAQAAAIRLKPGHILVADYQADASNGAIIDVDPKTGKQTLVSADSQAVNTGDPLFAGGPTDVQVLRDGTLLVADYAVDSLFTVDPATGKQTRASVPSDPGPRLDFVISAVPRADGTFLASAEDAFSDNTGGLFSVNPSTGASKVVSSNNQAVNSAAPLFSDPGNSFLSPQGKILTIDDSAAPDANGALIAVAKNGRQRLVSDNAQAVNSASQFLDTPRGVARGDGRIFVSNEGAPRILTVSAKTGKQKILAEGAPLEGPEHLAFDRSGNLLTADYLADAVFRVNRKTGAVKTVSSNAQPVNSGDPLFVDPFGIAVVPPKCFGQFATITGTDGPDTLKGTKYPDVIAGLGGRDKIKGLAGNDRICGGGGKDRIDPGAGHDHVKP